MMDFVNGDGVYQRQQRFVGRPLSDQLVRAANLGNVERVGQLLDQGANIESMPGLANLSALGEACYMGHVEMVALLLDRGADANAEYVTGGGCPLAEASLQGHLAVVELLVARGANFHRVGTYGQSKLLTAACYDCLPVCEFFLSKGADLMVASDGGWTALTHYGQHLNPPLSDTDKALRCAALEAAWAEGPHPSQVQRRKDERWARRWPFVFVLVTHGFRPLLHRALAQSLAIDPAAPIPQPVIESKEQRHAHLLTQVLTNEGIVRLIVGHM